MTRAELLTYVQNQFSSLITDTEWTNTDTAGGLKPILDRVFLTLGVSFSGLSTATIDDSLAIDALALTDYFGYNFFLTLMADRVDIAYDERATNRLESQSPKLILAAKQAALEECQRLGYLKTRVSYGTLMLDYLEVDEVEGE